MLRTCKKTVVLNLPLVMLAVLTIAGCSQSRSVEKKDPENYTAALKDPDNILEAPTEPLIPADAQSGGILRRTLGDMPKGFNWLLENGADVQELQSYVHNTFATRDSVDPDKWIPQLAAKVEISEDHLTYTVHLRKGIYWQVPSANFTSDKYGWLKEPRELTAEDAVFYFDLIQNPMVHAGAIQSYYRELDHAEVVDRYTFKVIWTKKAYQAKEFTLAAYPLPKWLFAKNENGTDIPESSIGTRFNAHWASRVPIGTGPYRINDIKNGQSILLERNEHYWDTKPPIEKIEYQIIPDPSRAYRRFIDGDLDFVALEPSVYRQEVLEGEPRSPFHTGELQSAVVNQPIFYYIGWNADKAIFSDSRVRTAMTYALDRVTIIEDVLGGLGRLSNGPFLPDHPANNPEVTPYPYNLNKAAALLRDAGWEDTDGNGILDKVIDGQKTEFDFTITAYNNPTTRSYLSMYKMALKKIGVEMTPSYVDWGLMQKKMTTRDFDAYTGGWGLGWSTDPYQLWHSSQADNTNGSNHVAFRNEQADDIIERLRVTFDEDTRNKLLQKFHMILHKEQPYTFLYQPQIPFAWQPYLENINFQKLRPQDLSLPWWIKDETP